jgi:hypothetical protein
MDARKGRPPEREPRRPRESHARQRYCALAPRGSDSSECRGDGASSALRVHLPGLRVRQRIPASSARQDRLCDCLHARECGTPAPAVHGGNGEKGRASALFRHVAWAGARHCEIRLDLRARDGKSRKRAAEKWRRRTRASGAVLSSGPRPGPITANRRPEKAGGGCLVLAFAPN